MRLGKGTCEVCLRRLSKRSLTILHDDQGDHELCSPCEERWSRQLMTLFAREMNQYAEASAFRLDMRRRAA